MKTELISPSPYGEARDLPKLVTASTGDDKASPLGLLGPLIRRKWSVLGFVALCAAGMATWMATLDPRYTAEALVVLDTRQSDATGFKNVVGNSPPITDPALVRSEIQVLGSVALAGRVIDELKLNQLEEFSADRPGVVRRTIGGAVAALERATGSPQWLRTALEHTGVAEMLKPRDDAPAREAAALDTYMERLGLFNDGRSFALHISFSSAEPELAAAIANAHARAYIDSQLEVKVEATHRATAWMTEQLGRLTDKLRVTEQTLQAYRDEHGLAANENVNIIRDYLEGLNTRLIAAEGELAEKNARHQQIRLMLANRGSLEATDAVLGSTLIQSLRAQEGQLIQTLGAMRANKGDQHPEIARKRAELADLRGKIGEETRKIATSLEEDLKASVRKVETLRQEVAQASEQLALKDRAGLQYAEIQRTADADRSLVKDLMVRAQEIAAVASMQAPDARLVSPAKVPVRPSYPRKVLWLVLTVFAAGGIASVVVLTLDRQHGGFRTTAEVEEKCRVPVLGTIPFVAGGPRGLRRPSDHVVGAPRSFYTESVFAVTNQIRRLRHLGGLRTFLLTSSLPKEGKSTVAVSVGRAVSSFGEQVLIIDCDLWHSSISEYVTGKPTMRGFGSVVRGEVDLADVIRADEQTGLHYLAAEPVDPEEPPQRLFGSAAFRNFVHQASEHYDLVLLDSPPITAANDAAMLSQCVDGTLMVLRAESTPKALFWSVLRTLEAASTNVCGAILVGVRFDRSADFSSGDIEKYKGKYRRYRSSAY